MVLCSLRSLLLAAVVLVNCITWTASRHHYTHNVSGHRSRHRRQGKGLYLTSSYVIPGGEGAGWGEWGETTPCSRTCGGGVASQKRICLQFGLDGEPQCTGGDTKYFSCETQDCPGGAGDFRAEQCSNYNNVTYRGVRYKWKPYTRGPNPCELNCMPPGERFYYRHQAKVIDGTRCNDDSFDVCVNGTCQPVGCDMMLGSNAREDKCRRCRGNGKDCYTTNGILDTQDLIKGYNDMLLIPEGATTIVITEVRPSNNYLALRAKNGTFYLNGDYHIDFPRSMMIAGALWTYERSQQGFAAPDKLRCLGPTFEPLYLSLLLQSENVGIEYEYSLPSERAPRPAQNYTWVHEDFGPCSAACGGGFQTRNVTCRTQMDLEVVDDMLCDDGLKPVTNQTCNSDPCPAQWAADEWGPCSKRCGDGGTQSRDIRCEKVIVNGFTSIVSDKECFDLHGPKPEKFRECNVNTTCPKWFTGPWKPCSKLYGEGTQTRQVVCYQKNGRRIDVLEDSECADEKPKTEQTCLIHPDDRTDWVTSAWVGCDTCLSKVRTRNVKCSTFGRTLVDDKFCSHHNRPVHEEPCDKKKLPKCEVQWYASQWSKCSAECGDGIQTRRVFCGMFVTDSVVVVKDVQCSHLPKYNDTKPCTVPKEQCPSQWVFSPWEPCDKKCGGGEQHRQVFCVRGEQRATDCSGLDVPDSTQSCNHIPCNEDDIIPLDAKSTPIIDEEECDYDEEEYSEVGLDFATPIGGSAVTTNHKALRDSPAYDTSLSTEEFLTTGVSGSDSSDAFSIFDITDTTDTADTTDTTDTDDSFTTDTDTYTTDDATGTTDSSTATPKTLNVTEPRLSKTTAPGALLTSEFITTEGSGSEPGDTGTTESTDGPFTTDIDIEDYDIVNSTTSDTSSASDLSIIEGSGSETTATTDSTYTMDTTDYTEPTDLSTTSPEDSSKSTSDLTAASDTASTEETETDINETTATDVTESEPSESPTISTMATETEETMTTKKGTTSSKFERTTVHSTMTEETDETILPEKEITSYTDIDETTESGSTESEPSEKSTIGTMTTDTEETKPSEEGSTTPIIDTTESGSTQFEPSEKSTLSTMTTVTEETESSEGGTTISTIDNETTTAYPTTTLKIDETTLSEKETTSYTDVNETTETGSSESEPSEKPTIDTMSTETELTGSSKQETSTLSLGKETTTSQPPTTLETEKTTLSEAETSSDIDIKKTTETGSTIAEEAISTISIENRFGKKETKTPKITYTTTTEAMETESSKEETSTLAIEKETTTTQPTMTLKTEETTLSEKESTVLTDVNETTETGTTEAGSSEKTTISTIPVPTVTTQEETETEAVVTSSTTEAAESTTLTTKPLLVSEPESAELTTEVASTTVSLTTGEEEAAEVSTTSSLSTKETTEGTAEISTTTIEEQKESSTTKGAEYSTEFSTTEISTESTESSSVTEEFTTSKVTEEKEPTTPISTITTESGAAEPQGTTTEAVTEQPTTTGTSPRMTIQDVVTTYKGHCKPRKIKCRKTKYGCCPDLRTPAKGPYDEGCLRPETCKESTYGCCPDGVSPAQGQFNAGCPVIPCAETLFGCCLSDNKTASEGNDQEGCPPPPPACESSTYGCCSDGITEATGLNNEGCPTEATEPHTKPLTTTVSESESSASETTEGLSSTQSKSSTESPESTERSTTTTELLEIEENCTTTEFGCCADFETPAAGPMGQGCPCFATEHGCCPDNKTPAHGPNYKGCCALTAYGCCPDNYKSADGPHLEGCGCQYAQFGCCPDNATIAKGPNKEGCGCQYTAYGCCPDRHTEALGPEFEGCGCHTYQFGCCPDGVTVATDQTRRNCDCRASDFGCCGDGKTPAVGPNREGCDCATSEFGCCPDGHTEAQGHKFLGCTDIPENRQAACSLPTDRGTCRNYSVYWFYDLEYGGCSRFWYGGCEGNGNRFATQEECNDVCVQPAPKDACKLPKVKATCAGYHIKWYYDYETEQCNQFIYGGCLGNANNFESQEQCQAQCEPTRTEGQCELPIERGSCAGNFGRWGFNSETRRCEQFIWGGCEGNANRFSSEAACVQRCDPPGTPRPQCKEVQFAGNCTDKEPVWSFSETENRCVPFYYTGCDGNSNRFASEESCAQACPSAYVPDVCTLPAEGGTCADYREKWYYDTTENRCRRFFFGGCGGNANNFASEQECESRCSNVPITTTLPQPDIRPSTDLCFLEKDPGPCTESYTRWLYDYKAGRCVAFSYSGCGGNQNNFPTEEHCNEYCHSAQDICQMPMRSGPCNDSIMSWFYDPSSDSCSQFTYGGCEGNGNRFNNREDCERRCRTGVTTQTTHTSTTTTTTMAPEHKETLPSECYPSPSLEPCVRAGQVWYVNSYGECVSHDNLDSGDSCRNTGVFPTQEACERSCGAFRNIDVCSYTLDPGPCSRFVPKYYFDSTIGRCREFVYGGCHGGPNRFSSIDECQQVCGTQIDPCEQDAEAGNCIERYVQWYYDRSRDECFEFIYGGCGGNTNRFETREDCEGRCRKSPTIALTNATSTTTTTTTTITTLAPTSQPLAPECRTPESLEPCGDNVTVFYFDEASGRCVAGEFGACRYPNTFVTEEECERRCGEFRDKNVCEASLDPGPCRASIMKYYWDRASGSCQEYAYGGCGGGPNRFSTIAECEQICGSTGPAAACLQPVSTGSADCGEPSRRWHYSVAQADCIVFTYQGCGGTANNFFSYEQCTQLCRVPKHTDCRPYDDECLQLVCPFGMARETTPEGCTKCTCVDKIADCEPMRAECEALRCRYGVLRTRERNGCERCQCEPDPCLRQQCPPGESCVPFAQPDPITREPHYSAVCKLINEVPDCGQFNDECSRLQCEYGVQRTRTVDGCERCACVQVDIDCAPLRLECAKLKCHYGMKRMEGRDGCPRCRCNAAPCSNMQCEAGHRCVATPYKDPIAMETRYTAECRQVNKPGYCPSAAGDDGAGERCNDDADCRGVGKCCGRQCAVPDESTPPPFTTHAPDLPQAPQVSHETEPEVSASEGGKASLRCIFHGNPPPKISWRRGEITIDSDVGRYRLLSDGTLEIVSLYRNDSGVYICVAENSLGIAEQEVHLQVNDPVESPAGIAGEQNAVFVGELGKRLVVRCLIYGYPLPTVSWHYGPRGSMVPYSSTLYEARHNTLLIRRLTYETVGEYECHAYNARGRPATWRFVVKAHQIDDTPTTNPYILPRIVMPEEAIPIKVIEVTTHRDFIPVTTTTTSTTTERVIFNKPMFTVPVHTKLSAAATSLTVGSELSLTCEVDGYPEPELYWAKDNKRIIPNDNIEIYGTSLSRLTVSRVSLSDAGTYGCHARNDYTSHYSYVQITVQTLTIPSKCTDSPFFANCSLIVRSKFCKHKYYSTFCCKSCMEAGQLSVQEAEMQADQPLVKRK